MIPRVTSFRLAYLTEITHTYALPHERRDGSEGFKLHLSDKRRNLYLFNFLTNTHSENFIFEFPCIISLYYIRNQLYATLAELFISHCKITLHVSDAFCVHHQEYINCSSSHWCTSWVGMMYIQERRPRSVVYSTKLK